MAKIKNMGTATMRFNEGIIVTGSAGIDTYALVVTGSSIISEGLTVSGYTLPTSDGSANQVIKTDGSGNLSFTNQSGGSGSPGGSDTHIQINNGGSFGGVDNLAYDGSELFVSSSIRLIGEQIINDPTYSGDANQKNRSFTLKRHYNISQISANAFYNVISWRPYVQGTTDDPGSNSFYGSVGFKIEISGHTNGVGNGYKSRVGYVSYEGSSAANAGASDTNLGSTITTDVNRSGWVTTLRINPNQGGATGFSGTVYVEVYFARGGGSNGQNITWSVT